MMAVFKKHDQRCPVCLSEFNSQEMRQAGFKSCPVCKTTLQPLTISHDGYIRINWQDMRVLAIYARRWSMGFDLTKKGNRDAIQALENIIANLSKYKPNMSEPIVPAVDAFIVGNMQAEYNLDNVPLNLKPDHTGMIPSPFYKRMPPPF